jgi:hypothetical protein
MLITVILSAREKIFIYVNYVCPYISHCTAIPPPPDANTIFTYAHVDVVAIDGCGLIIGFIGRLDKQLVTLYGRSLLHSRAETYRDTETHGYTTDTYRHRETHTHTDKKRHTHTRHIDTQRHTHTHETHRHTATHTHTHETHRHTPTHTHTHTHTLVKSKEIFAIYFKVTAGLSS